MEEEHRDKTQSYLRQRMNGTGGDMPTGYRPCPFCHAVIAWQSERCPSCGRVLVERVGSGPSWSVFQPARRSAHSRWLRSIPATTERERQILLIASAVMVLFLLISLVIR
jgi:hypothetical protein